MRRSGFTIVELLIVIVVIAILAAITIVAYNGIQDRAKNSAAQSAAAQASKRVQQYFIENSDTYPADETAFNSLNITSGSASYQYVANNSSNPKTFCITATVQNKSYFINNTSQTSPTPGGCSGHGQGGVAAISNLVPNPKGVVLSSGNTGEGWFRLNLSGTITETYNVSWNGRSDWHRFTATTSNNGRRLYLPLARLENGESYTVSIVAGNDGTSSANFGFDFSDQNSSSFTIAPGEQRRISFVGTRSAYDSTFRFVDLHFNVTSATGFLLTDVMVTKGSTLHAFADGNSQNWAWTGDANNSPSAGPPL